MGAAEPIDVVTATGIYVATAPRQDVHDEGLWHQVFHCLVIRPGEAAKVVLQRRHRSARAFPGLLDLSATGHLLAGEQPIDGVREAEEELGIAIDQHDLVPVGVRLLADDAGEGQNRERVHLYFFADERPLDKFNPDPDEVDALIEVGARDILAVLAEPNETVSAKSWRPGQQIESITVGANDLIKPADGYWTVALLMADRFAKGETILAV